MDACNLDFVLNYMYLAVLHPETIWYFFIDILYMDFPCSGCEVCMCVHLYIYIPC